MASAEVYTVNIGKWLNGCKAGGLCKLHTKESVTHSLDDFSIFTVDSLFEVVIIKNGVDSPKNDG